MDTPDWDCPTLKLLVYPNISIQYQWTNAKNNQKSWETNIYDAWSDKSTTAYIDNK